ncbi:MAG TPA: SOS response-associated peptidase [Chitinophagales bacterium]|nr:SOS response-associated peptidase [Chitinophagales bacterium]
MCSVYSQKIKNPVDEKIEGIEAAIMGELFAAAGNGYEPVYNAWIGNNQTFLYTADGHVKQMVFGLTPAWSERPMFLFNARAEGKLNPANDPNYDGENGIFKMPSFRSAIAKRRAVLPVSFFVEGPEKEKLKKPFKVHRKDNRTFFVGCIWETWTDKSTGETMDTFAMVTTAPAKLLHDVVKHHRSPLILDGDAIKIWLDENATPQGLAPLMKPFDSTAFTAHPISQAFKTKENKAEFFEPVEISDC